MHADVDYMDRKRPFTIDPTNFHRLPGYLNDLHAAGMKLVIVLVSNNLRNGQHDVIALVYPTTYRTLFSLMHV